MLGVLTSPDCDYIQTHLEVSKKETALWAKEGSDLTIARREDGSGSGCLDSEPAHKQASSLERQLLLIRHSTNTRYERRRRWLSSKFNPS